MSGGLRIELGLETKLGDIAVLSLIEGETLNYGEYDERDSNVYAPGGPIALYYTIPSMSYAMEGSWTVTRLEEPLTITDDASDHKTISEYERTYTEDEMSKFYPAPLFHFPAVQNVQYTLTVELEDRLSGQVMTDSLDLHVDEDGDLNFRMENDVQL